MFAYCNDRPVSNKTICLTAIITLLPAVFSLGCVFESDAEYTILTQNEIIVGSCLMQESYLMYKVY